ncbi:MAG: amidophosphoribosyltransferase [Candidatus Neomarinimicrobiota bacterium]|nr:MAG: amidophosphoribosyltransferase [Candidatus Neomarinimicrobiota bacterium]
MCGIAGIFGSEEASNLVYLCLYALQHRGQEGAGITSYDGKRLKIIKDFGLVSEVFSERKKFNYLRGEIAIGHVRYSTHGESSFINIQPLTFSYKNYHIAISHNGNLINLKSLKRELEDRGAIFQTTSDTEFIVHLMAQSKGDIIEERLINALRKVEGAYSLLIMVNDKLIAVRDKYGFRPLCMGKLGNAVVFASETCALDLIGAEYERDVNPGEMIIVDKSGLRSIQFEEPRPHYCIFEYVYFSRPDSRIFGEYVDKTRRKLGKNLAIESPVDDADIVFSIPDSSNTTALGYAQKANLQYEIGLIRNHYVGRTFIHPQQMIRDFSVKVKFNPIGGVIKGKKVVIVDDSIVRGTTLRKLVNLIKKEEPKEIHIRIGSPPIRYPCYYGMDFPSQNELIAYKRSISEIKEYLDVDSLEYLSVEGLLKSMSLPPEQFCTACFTGKYIEPIREYKRSKEEI